MMFKTTPTEILQQLAKQHTDVSNDLSISLITDRNWLDKWLEQYLPEAVGNFHDWKEGGRLVRVLCPFNLEHGHDAYITQSKGGAISAGCHHDSCKDKDWHDFRAIKETSQASMSKLLQQQSNVPIPLEAISSDILPTLEDNLIPNALLPYCRDLSHRMQIPQEYVITTLLIGFSALLGNRFCVYPKVLDNWRVTGNLWGMIVGDPGSSKTPVIKEVSKYINRLDDSLASQLRQMKQQYANNLKTLESQIKAISKQSNPTSQLSTNQTQLEQQLETLKNNPPLETRIIVKDITIEKLQELLVSNPNGLYFLVDELSNLFRTLEKQGHENDRGFLLEAWNGMNSYSVDRIGRGSIRIDQLCLSILGTIQPTVLHDYISKTKLHDGFLSRFQIVMFPPKQKNWEYVNQVPDIIAERTIHDLIDFFYRWHPQQDANGSKYRKNGYGEYPGVIFNEKAQLFFQGWYTKLMRRLQSDDMPQIMKEHLSKYSALMGKLSLIFHIIEHAHTGSIPAHIDEITAVRAAAWCEYLEPHAEKMYGLQHVSENGVVNTALAILRKIRDGRFDCNTINDIVRKDWQHCNNLKQVEEAVSLLQRKNWLRLEHPSATPQGGRPTEYIKLHPQIAQYLQQESQYLIKIRNKFSERPYLDLIQSLLYPPQRKCDVARFLYLTSSERVRPFTPSKMNHPDLLQLKLRKTSNPLS